MPVLDITGNRRCGMRRHVTNVALIVAVVGAGLAAGCSSRSGPVNAGPGSAQDERRQFAGEWVLVSYEVIDENGQARRLAAAGRIAIDAFANIKVDGSVEDPNAAGGSATILSGSGRLVIDVPNKRYLILDVEGNLNLGQGAFESAPPESLRYYELTGDELRVEIRNADGQVTARINYQRAG